MPNSHRPADAGLPKRGWHQELAPDVSLHPATPLWQRAPTHTEDGRPVSDFMMVIPGMKRWQPARLKQTLDCLNEILAVYRDVVLLADLNLRINVLWVSVRPVPGLCAELPAAIHHRIPEARLVAQRLD